MILGSKYVGAILYVLMQKKIMYVHWLVCWSNEVNINLQSTQLRAYIVSAEEAEIAGWYRTLSELQVCLCAEFLSIQLLDHED